MLAAAVRLPLCVLLARSACPTLLSDPTLTPAVAVSLSLSLAHTVDRPIDMYTATALSAPSATCLCVSLTQPRTNERWLAPRRINIDHSCALPLVIYWQIHSHAHTNARYISDRFR